MCDTATNKITKTKIKPTFLTKGGDWSKQNKAKKLERYALGQLYHTHFYEKAPLVFLNATILGTGCLKIYRIGKEIYLDRVLKPELWVDYSDAMYGEPRNLFHVKHFHREVLLEMFPDYETEIMGAGSKREEDPIYGAFYKEESKTDLVKVIESWHLPSGPEATDGKHTIAIDSIPLLEEEYTRNFFPFAFIRWSPPQYGFWGTGIANILTGIQVEINKILKENQDIFHLMDIPQVWMEAGSKIVTSHFDNQIGSIHTFTGTQPQSVTMGSVSQQRFAYLQWLIQSAYELVGISQLSAQSKKPEGLDSGKSLRTFHDIETERFAMVEREWENFTLETVRQINDLSAEIAKEDKTFKILVGCGKTADEIKWNDINLACDEYIMQTYPTNLLADDPSSRLADVQEMMQAGLYTAEEGRKLLDFPDTAALNNYLNADQEDIELTIERMIEHGEYNPPEPLQNLQMGSTMMQRAYLRAKINQVPEERLELMRRWIAGALHMLIPPPPMEVPPGAPQEPIPMANPMPTPTNEMVPNVPQETIPNPTLQ